MLLSFVGNIFSADSKAVPALAGAACTVGTIVFNKGSSITREVTDFIAQHKVGACVAGIAAIGSGMYAYGKYKERAAAAEKSSSQPEDIFVLVRRELAAREARICKVTEDRIQEGLEMKEAFQDIRKALG